MIKKIKKYSIVAFLKFLQYLFLPFIKIDNKLALFSSLNGSFSDNSKYLYLAMLESKKFKVYWVAHDTYTYNYLKKNNMPVLKINLNMFFIAQKARFFITTHSLEDVYYVKNKNTILINLWHGTPLKKMGFDSKVDAKKFSLQKKLGLFKHEKIDFLCVSSKHTIDAFKSSFGIDKNKILPTGQPRNDILYKAKNDILFAQSIKNNVKERLKMQCDTIALYAPTFRDKHTCRLDLLKELQKIFKNNGIDLIIKLHPLDKDIKHFGKIDIDIQELLIASDMLISDYSSVIFDYAILQKPIILFLYDIDEYKAQRDGFYIDIESLPFYKCYNTSQIRENLQNFLKNSNEQKIAEFAIKYNRVGCSSCRIATLLEKLLIN